MNDIELDVPDRAVCRHLQLEDRIALARILPMLQNPGAAPVGRPGIFRKDDAITDKPLNFNIQTFSYSIRRHRQPFVF
jgi:hypothetical protein